MKGKKINITILIIIVLGIIVGFGTFSILNPRMTTVYLFNNNYKIDTEINTDMLVPLQTSTSAIKAMNEATNGRNNYITDKNISNYQGKKLTTDVTAGGFCMQLDFGGENGNKGNMIETKLDKDKMAISLQADSIIAGNPHIKQGSRINLLTAFELQDGSKVTNIELQNIRVMDVIKTTDECPQIKGITLEVTPKQATALDFALEYGKVRLAIIKSQYKNVKIEPYSLQDIKIPTPITQSTQKSK